MSMEMSKRPNPPHLFPQNNSSNSHNLSAARNNVSDLWTNAIASQHSAEHPEPTSSSSRLARPTAPRRALSSPSKIESPSLDPTQRQQQQQQEQEADFKPLLAPHGFQTRIALAPLQMHAVLQGFAPRSAADQWHVVTREEDDDEARMVLHVCWSAASVEVLRLSVVEDAERGAGSIDMVAYETDEGRYAELDEQGAKQLMVEVFESCWSIKLTL